MSISFSSIKATLSKQFPKIESKDWDSFFQICTYKKCKNKEIVIAAGSKTKTAIYVISGVVRGYSTNSNGEQVNLFLRPEGYFVASYDQLLENIPTKYSFESILQAEVLLFDIEKFEALCKEIPSLFDMYIWALKSAVVVSTRRIELMIEKTPEERYELLLKNYPIFFQKAFNKHIANYLGITPVSLSRIVKRTKEK